MGYAIKFLLLNKSELQYEVGIRGETPANVVRDLRCQVTKLTQLYLSEDIIDSVYDFDTDIKGINESLQKVQSNLAELGYSKQQALLDRTRSLLNHIYFRTIRINKPTTTEQSEDLKKATKIFNEFYAHLNKLKPDTESQHDKNQTEDVEGASVSAGLQNLNVSVTCDRGMAADVTKLKYDGKSCVRSFAQKLEEFRISKGMTHAKMFSLSYDLFTGDALHWFRSISHSVTCWDDLITRLKTDFDIIDYDYRMMAEIRSRTQGDRENIIIYLSIMKGMFSRLTKELPEAEMLDILLHNIRPVYTQILASCPNVKSIDQLRDLCKNYEQVMARAADFKEPPSSSSSTLAPEFSYTYYNSNSKPNRSSYRQNSTNPFYSQTDSRQQFCSKFQTGKVCALEAPKPKTYCHRCRVDTHSMKDCPSEREIFCFKCGMKEVKTPECPNCSPQTQSLDTTKN